MFNDGRMDASGFPSQWGRKVRRTHSFGVRPLCLQRLRLMLLPAQKPSCGTVRGVPRFRWHFLSIFKNPGLRIQTDKKEARASCYAV